MKAHWVDTASDEELNKLGVLSGLLRLSGEDDDHFRARLKRAVSDYQGGGTVPAILDAVKALINAKSDEAVMIVENPPAAAFDEFRVRAGDTWSLRSNSITDAQPNITLTVEEEGEVNNPKLINLDTKEYIAFRGNLKKGQQLTIKKKKAYINGKDVSKQILPRKIPALWLLRKGSEWGYTETFGPLVGLFDEAKFNEHIFLAKVPSVTIRFDWTRLQPATFEVHIKSKALRGSSRYYLESVINSMKAAGVNAVIKVSG
jgi:hypothetical protein